MNQGVGGWLPDITLVKTESQHPILLIPKKVSKWMYTKEKEVENIKTTF